MAKSRKDNKGRVLRKGETSVAMMVSMFIRMLIQKENDGVFILKTSWSCVKEKKS